MTPEFTHSLTVAEIGQGRTVELTADEAQRAAVAARLSLIDLKTLSFTAKLTSIAGGVKAIGHLDAHVVQRCAATDLAVPAKISEDFDLRFLNDVDPAAAAEDEEIEISSDDCEVMPLENGRVDVAEAAVQSLSLALDPFPRHPDADRILREKGVITEGQAGPFAALAALKAKND
jgi:uncharacterized metal-binding protein YceD (DUF177 family)